MQGRSISRNPEPTIEAVREYWNNHVHDWKIARNPAGTREFFEEIEEYRYEKLDYLADAIKFDRFAGQTVLDVGCGVGNDMARFARAGASVTGIDLSEKAVMFARENFKQRGLQGNIEQMNGEAMSFPDDCFDAVFCHTVLHFTPNPRAMIEQIHRVLKPGGEAILMTINRKSWMNLLRALMKIEVDYLDAPVFNTFTIAEFRELLSPFTDLTMVPHRFPVRTRVHKGLKASAYNVLFVDLFNALPRSWVRNTGYHLIAYARK